MERTERKDIVTEDKKTDIMSFLKSIMLYAVVVLSMFVIFKVVLLSGYVPSASMEPTLMTGDFFLGNRIGKDIQRYDIIVFKYPDDESKYFIKRVIGMPGETVEVKNSAVYINGEKIDDPYCQVKMDTSGDGIYKVPDDSYFVMGDNRNDSLDSRFWKNKYVAKNKIIAEAQLRIKSGLKMFTPGGISKLDGAKEQ